MQGTSVTVLKVGAGRGGKVERMRLRSHPCTWSTKSPHSRGKSEPQEQLATARIKHPLPAGYSSSADQTERTLRGKGLKICFFASAEMSPKGNQDN